MSHTIRTLSIAVILAAATTVATAQTNPAARGARDSFSFGQFHGAQTQAGNGGFSTPLGGSQIGRPVAHFGPVTPVPEPSEWAMMLAGLALVGFIVRRNSKRS